jgi:hypothetical protein
VPKKLELSTIISQCVADVVDSGRFSTWTGAVLSCACALPTTSARRRVTAKIVIFCCIIVIIIMIGCDFEMYGYTDSDNDDGDKNEMK